MDILLSLIPGGNLTVIISAVGFILLAIWRIFTAGKKSARNQSKAEKVDAYEQHLSDIERAVSARNDVLSGRVQPDPEDPNRRD